MVLCIRTWSVVGVDGPDGPDSLENKPKEQRVVVDNARVVNVDASNDGNPCSFLISSVVPR